MNRIERKFKELKKSGKKAFIAFLTAGYPSLAVSEKLILEFSKIGVDIIELGVPFSDPMADGPVIQESSKIALDNKVTLSGILALVRRCRKFTDIPICLMTYYNPVFCFGEGKFSRQASACGVDGVIVPDLPPEEAGPLIASARRNNLDTVFFIAPTSRENRIKLISRVSTGFIYYVCLTGVTGPRQELPSGFIGQIKLIKKNSKKPVCVGFGVSTPKQVRQAAKAADGVIVGSAIVQKIKENIGSPDLVKKVSGFVSFLKKGL